MPRPRSVRYTALLKQRRGDAGRGRPLGLRASRRAEANILAAQAQVAIAKLNLGYTEVRAPFDGQMGKHLIDPGNVVGGNGQQAALAEITQLDPIYVVANISSQQALADPRQPRPAPADAGRAAPGSGRGGAVGRDRLPASRHASNMSRRQIDPATGTLLVRGILRNPDRTLLPGVFVNIRLPMGKVAKSALLVPQRSRCRRTRAAAICWSSTTTTSSQQRYVQLGELVGDLRVITSGARAATTGSWSASSGARRRA